jgi:hypothetical protein
MSMRIEFIFSCNPVWILEVATTIGPRNFHIQNQKRCRSYQSILICWCIITYSHILLYVRSTLWYCNIPRQFSKYGKDVYYRDSMRAAVYMCSCSSRKSSVRNYTPRFAAAAVNHSALAWLRPCLATYGYEFPIPTSFPAWTGLARFFRLGRRLTSRSPQPCRRCRGAPSLAPSPQHNRRSRAYYIHASQTLLSSLLPFHREDDLSDIEHKRRAHLFGLRSCKKIQLLARMQSCTKPSWRVSELPVQELTAAAASNANSPIWSAILPRPT